jgi:hypothetical protein
MGGGSRYCLLEEKIWAYWVRGEKYNFLTKRKRKYDLQNKMKTLPEGEKLKMIGSIQTKSGVTLFCLPGA